MSTIGTILSLVLAAAFAGAGGTKVANVGPHETDFERYQLPVLPAQRARLAVGCVELVAAVLFVIAVIASSKAVAVAAAIIVVLTMAGALSTHVRIHDPAPKMAPATVLGILAVLVIVLV